MNTRIQSNMRFLGDLFGGEFRGHAIIMDAGFPPVDWSRGDFAISDEPIEDWLPDVMRLYEARLQMHEAIEDDSVPYAQLLTGTELFAAAFGCRTHIYPDTLPCALPLVTTAEEADQVQIPSLHARPFERVFQLGHMVRERLGPDVPIGVPDIQSPFDMAALIWRKEDLFVAMIESPDAVKRLVEKCYVLLRDFLRAFMREFPNCNLCHCPYSYAPPEQGCWLSEDEAGCLNTAMFDEFCVPSLTRLSDDFGGIGIHCCATADHQYQGFRRIPRLRGLNRVFQFPGPRPAVEAFAGETVLVLSWIDEAGVNDILDMARPTSRFLLNMPVQPVDDARRTFERLRERCPRNDAVNG